MPTDIGQGVDTWFYGCLISDSTLECSIRIGQVSVSDTDTTLTLKCPCFITQSSPNFLSLPAQHHRQPHLVALLVLSLSPFQAWQLYLRLPLLGVFLTPTRHQNTRWRPDDTDNTIAPSPLPSPSTTGRDKLTRLASFLTTTPSPESRSPRSLPPTWVHRRHPTTTIPWSRLVWQLSRRTVAKKEVEKPNRIQSQTRSDLHSQEKKGKRVQVILPVCYSNLTRTRLLQYGFRTGRRSANTSAWFSSHNF